MTDLIEVWSHLFLVQLMDLAGWIINPIDLKSFFVDCFPKITLAATNISFHTLYSILSRSWFIIYDKIIYLTTPVTGIKVLYLVQANPANWRTLLTLLRPLKFRKNRNITTIILYLAAFFVFEHAARHRFRYFQYCDSETLVQRAFTK